MIIITGLDLLLNIGVSYLSTKRMDFLPFVIFHFYDVKPPHAFEYYYMRCDLWNIIYTFVKKKYK